MKEEFQHKKILIYGTGGSGKTEYAKSFLWSQFRLPLAYDVSGDFQAAKGGLAYFPHDIDGEFMHFLKLYQQINQKRKVDAIFFDDADVYVDYKMAAEPFFKDLVVRHRNKGLSIIFISKRPQNLPTIVTNNFHIMKCFLMEGKNALDRIQDEDERILELLEKIEPFGHVHKTTGKPPQLMKAIKIK